jgi:hypothetical protein
MCSVFLLETFLFSPYVLSCKGSVSVDAPMAMKFCQKDKKQDSMVIVW